MLVEEQSVHGGKRWLDVGADIARREVIGCPRGRGERALGPHRQILYREAGVHFKFAVRKCSQLRGGIVIGPIDIGAINKSRDAIKLFSMTGRIFSAYCRRPEPRVM